MDGLPRTLVLQIRGHFPLLRTADHRRDAIATRIPDDRIDTRSRFNPSFTVDSPITLDHAVASYAGNPFAKNMRPIEKRRMSGMIHLSGDRRMAAHAERSYRTAGQVENQLFEPLKHW